MSKYKISPTNDYLLRDGKPFFYLADTVWMAFANLPLDEWERYLAYRRLQGFTALQISILPVTHDTSMSDENANPFLSDGDGNWDFNRLNEAYFDKCRERWSTWPSTRALRPSSACCGAATCPARVARSTAPSPRLWIWRPSHPTPPTPPSASSNSIPCSSSAAIHSSNRPTKSSTIWRRFEAVKTVCPDALLTMHLTPNGELSRSFVDAIDFYMYQSGHHVERQDRPYTLAEKFMAYPVKRPIVNSEPPYEGHGRVGSQTRFNAFDVRKATWQSLLSGAKMGVTYGAHGVWSCHRRGMTFLNSANSFEPYDWDQALLLDGAWDVSYARWLFETFNFFELEPSDVLVNEDPEIRAATNADRSVLAVYAPYTFDIELSMDLAGWRCRQIDLASRRVMTPEVESGEHSRIRMHSLNSDSLLLAEKG